MKVWSQFSNKFLGRTVVKGLKLYTRPLMGLKICRKKTLKISCPLYYNQLEKHFSTSHEFRYTVQKPFYGTYFEYIFVPVVKTNILYLAHHLYTLWLSDKIKKNCTKTGLQTLYCTFTFLDILYLFRYFMQSVYNTSDDTVQLIKYSWLCLHS